MLADADRGTGRGPDGTGRGHDARHARAEPFRWQVLPFPRAGEYGGVGERRCSLIGIDSFRGRTASQYWGSKHLSDCRSPSTLI